MPEKSGMEAALGAALPAGGPAVCPNAGAKAAAANIAHRTQSRRCMFNSITGLPRFIRNDARYFILKIGSGASEIRFVGLGAGGIPSLQSANAFFPITGRNESSQKSALTACGIGAT